MNDLIERVIDAMRDVPLTNMSDQFSDDPVHQAKLARAAIVATLWEIREPIANAVIACAQVPIRPLLVEFTDASREQVWSVGHASGVLDASQAAKKALEPIDAALAELRGQNNE